jgi:hypothetical protein
VVNGGDSPATPRAAGVDWGRPFVGHAFDYLVIGGGLSLLLTLYLRAGGQRSLSGFLEQHLGLLVLLSNSTHFAASTVRLYTKPGSFTDLRFLTMGLPLVTLAVLTAAIAAPAGMGRHLLALYFTWSPYHYAAQAYGLAMMYCYRSGGTWTDDRKRWIRAACLLPFVYAFLNVRSAGVEWFLPESLIAAPWFDAARSGILPILGFFSYALPVALFVWFGRGFGPRLPFISLLVIASNSVWWIALTFVDAFVWATVFHGLQYLAIVSIFHVRERLREPSNRTPWWTHAARFYAACLLLGFLLFQVWPNFYAFLGFGFVESLLLVVAVVNIHHFVVDAYIWRLRRDSNFAVVSPALPSAA